MITFLKGLLDESFPNRAVIDVGGVGYAVHIPISTYDALPGPGQPVRLLTHLQVREDAHDLYGFASEEERDLFRLLINQVSGVGPKLALAVLSGMPVAVFKSCVARNDLAALGRIKGVGKKTAERIVVELRDKVGVAAAWQAATADGAPLAPVARQRRCARPRFARLPSARRAQSRGRISQGNRLANLALT